MTSDGWEGVRNDQRNGGCAFPFVSHGGYDAHQMIDEGMSLRDWFAGQALVGIMLNESAYEWAPQGIATRANLVADAMLASRKREGQS